MKLVIHAHTLKNESLSRALIGHFDERGGTIGRSGTNTFTLPDPERHVSRLQAEVMFAGRAFSIRNVGSANPIELNGRLLRPGEGAPLSTGDQLMIAGYAMRVAVEKSLAGTAAQSPRVDLPTAIHTSVGEARIDPAPRADVARSALGAALRTAADVTDSSGDSATDAAGLTAPAAFDHAAQSADGCAEPTVTLPAPAAQALLALPPQVADVPPPLARSEEPLCTHAEAVTPPADPLAAADVSATPEALWRAFCEGSGLTMALPQGLNPQVMRVLGQLMHHAVEGTLKLVAARAATKQEFRSQATAIQSKSNNPLKFSADAQHALAQLLNPPMRGFMRGPDAMRDAMDDLLGNQIGTTAGTRAALQGIFKRFEPAQLEARLTNKGVIDAVLPMNRRAKLWELYGQHYEQVQEEAQNDFHQLFGEAFAKALELRLDRLEASRRKPG